MKRKNLLLILINFILFKNKILGDKNMRYAYKTINNNWMVEDRGRIRFIDTFGNHLRWVTDDEAEHLMKVLEIFEKYEAPAMRSQPHLPSEEIVWQHIVPPEIPELSSNGGSYAYLTRIMKRAGWEQEDGFYLVTNHLYGSDFEHQGWYEEKLWSEEEAMGFIEKYKIPV